MNAEEEVMRSMSKRSHLADIDAAIEEACKFRSDVHDSKLRKLVREYGDFMFTQGRLKEAQNAKDFEELERRFDKKENKDG